MKIRKGTIDKFIMVLFLLSTLTLATGLMLRISEYVYSKEILLLGLVMLLVSCYRVIISIIKNFVMVVNFIIKSIPVSLTMAMFLIGVLLVATGTFLTIAGAEYHLEVLLSGTVIFILSFVGIGYKILCLIVGFDILDELKNKLSFKTS